jgi:hypothetical protein
MPDDTTSAPPPPDDLSDLVPGGEEAIMAALLWTSRVADQQKKLEGAMTAARYTAGMGPEAQCWSYGSMRGAIEQYLAILAEAGRWLDGVVAEHIRVRVLETQAEVQRALTALWQTIRPGSVADPLPPTWTTWTKTAIELADQNRRSLTELLFAALEARWQTDEDPRTQPQEPSNVTGHENGVLPELLSAPALAKLLQQTKNRVEAKLRRYRCKHRDCCVEVDNPRRNQARILYRTAVVLPVSQQPTDG